MHVRPTRTSKAIFALILAAAISLRAAAQGVAIDATSATSANLKVVFNANDPERIDAIYWNPVGLTGTEPNLTNSATFSGDPCVNGLLEYFGNSGRRPTRTSAARCSSGPARTADG